MNLFEFIMNFDQQENLCDEIFKRNKIKNEENNLIIFETQSLSNNENELNFDERNTIEFPTDYVRKHFDYE